MKDGPKVQLLLSNGGIEQVEILYLKGQRAEAWRMCKKLLPLLDLLDCCARGEEVSEDKPESNED